MLRLTSGRPQGATSGRLRGVMASLAIAAALMAGAASAATVQIDAFERRDVSGALSARDALLSAPDLTSFGISGPQTVRSQVHTSFDAHAAWNGSAGTSNPMTTVGSFTSLGGIGHGRSAINGGAGLEVRNDDPWRWGRHSLMGENWLDSNDTEGMRWEAGAESAFNSLSFFLTDVADVGAKFSLMINGTLHENLIGAEGRTRNGTIHFVHILLPELVESAVVELRHDMLNDGFGIDGVTLAQIAPVPLPAGILLLGSGIVVLAGLRRRRRAAAT